MTALPELDVLCSNRWSVLIIADDPEFAPPVMGRWQSERQVPVFTLLGSELWNDTRSAAWDLAIVGPVRAGRLDAVLHTLESSPAPAVYMSDDAAVVHSIRSAHPRTTVLRPHDGWVDTLVIIACEMLRRLEATARQRLAERTAVLSQSYATLGRYILEMRHSFNNAMTSLLGNAELLLLEPAALSAQVREQIDTIHSMALRMREIMQRFSSLELEMQFAEGTQRKSEVRSVSLPVATALPS